ncbi:uncharacterized protein LOC118465321 [Anopheles albimanus]|uniref:Uncharacterized protein n=1 Tax=Anopheles albimanus TaxID=7167 RepID=A0A182FIX0_ANOAL|nr:uncharacterized protein LOC118465321 [Anopheles albimanus]
MLLLAFRSFFFIAVLLGYSTGIWRLINDYFRREFQSYLTEEVKTNKYLLQDPPQRSTPAAVTGSSSSNIPTSSSPSLLEENIIRVGRFLVANSDAAKPSKPDTETGQGQDEEARWVHYWKQRNDAAQGKAAEFTEDDVCTVREPDEDAGAALNCPG